MEPINHNPSPTAPKSSVIEIRPLYPEIKTKEQEEILEYIKNRFEKIQNNTDLCNEIKDLIPRNHMEFLALLAVRKSTNQEKQKAILKTIKQFKKMFY